MKTIQVRIPDKLAEELAALLREGWFQSEEEAVRFALLQFIESRQLALQERFQREDIEWALKQRQASR